VNPANTNAASFDSFSDRQVMTSREGVSKRIWSFPIQAEVPASKFAVRGCQHCEAYFAAKNVKQALQKGSNCDARA
ncbi:MAG: hypothetical protein K2X41_03465, partial [Hyphomicrobium sp.]|nr:hypothetical protein [Hyphomicrobium sp.]